MSTKRGIFVKTSPLVVLGLYAASSSIGSAQLRRRPRASGLLLSTKPAPDQKIDFRTERRFTSDFRVKLLIHTCIYCPVFGTGITRRPRRPQSRSASSNCGGSFGAVGSGAGFGLGCAACFGGCRLRAFNSCSSFAALQLLQFVKQCHIALMPIVVLIRHRQWPWWN